MVTAVERNEGRKGNWRWRRRRGYRVYYIHTTNVGKSVVLRSRWEKQTFIPSVPGGGGGSFWKFRGWEKFPGFVVITDRGDRGGEWNQLTRSSNSSRAVVVVAEENRRHIKQELSLYHHRRRRRSRL